VSTITSNDALTRTSTNSVDVDLDETTQRRTTSLMATVRGRRRTTLLTASTANNVVDDDDVDDDDADVLTSMYLFRFHVCSISD